METLFTFMLNLIAQLECQLAGYQVKNTEQEIQIRLLMEENEKLKTKEWNPLERYVDTMYDTFMAQSKIGNRLSFNYRLLTIQGRFRVSPFGDHENWRMCLWIEAHAPGMKKALSKYNAELDDIHGLEKAVQIINDAANQVELL